MLIVSHIIILYGKKNKHSKKHGVSNKIGRDTFVQRLRSFTHFVARWRKQGILTGCAITRDLLQKKTLECSNYHQRKHKLCVDIGVKTNPWILVCLGSWIHRVWVLPMGFVKPFPTVSNSTVSAASEAPGHLPEAVHGREEPHRSSQSSLAQKNDPKNVPRQTKDNQIFGWFLLSW